jgi:hypothetical protein
LALCSGAAHAERGLFTVSLQAGQVMGLERAVPLAGTLQYGFAECWSLAGVGGGEFSLGAPVVTLSLGPRFTLFRSTWWTLEALLAPEALWTPAAKRFEYGARAGLSVRYLLLWGVGLVLEGGARIRADAVGPFAPAVQGYLVGGLFIEA